MAIEETEAIEDIEAELATPAMLGHDIVHVDFHHPASEMITLDVRLELNGAAPGVAAGGVLVQTVHYLSIECPIVSIPDLIGVSVAGLQIGQSIKVGDLKLPTGLTVKDDPKLIVVQVSDRAGRDPESRHAAAIAPGGMLSVDALRSLSLARDADIRKAAIEALTGMVGADDLKNLSLAAYSPHDPEPQPAAGDDSAEATSGLAALPLDELMLHMNDAELGLLKQGLDELVQKVWAARQLRRMIRKQVERPLRNLRV